MPDLPEVSETFEVNVAPWVAGLNEAIQAAERFRDMNLEALASVEMLQAGMAGETAAANANAGANSQAANAALFLGTVNVEASENVERLATRLNDQMDAADKAAAADEVLSSRLNDMRDAALEAEAAMSRLEYEIAAASAAAGTAAVMVRPAMDAWRESIAGAANTAAEAEVLIDKLAGAFTESGADAALASIGVDQYRDAVAEAAVAAGTLGKAETAAGNAAASTTRFFWLTGNAIHWIISGTVELLAVLVPATVAAGAWAFVWVQGATNVYDHLKSLFTATEALGQAAGQTYGEMLGLKGAFQQAQNAANVNVYQALGSALLIIREQFGGLASVGLRMGQIFDAFMGRLVYDFSAAGGAGKTLGAVLSNMIPDLTEIGQVFGNLGAAIGSFAAQMPGLAGGLLQVLDSITNFVKIGVEFASTLHIGSWSILTFVMALEETNRWGGLVVGLFGRMGMASSTLATGIFNPVRAFGVLSNIVLALPMAFATLTSTIGSYVMRMTTAGTAMNNAGLAMRNFGADMTDTLTAITPLQGALAAVAIGGVAFLAYKMLTAKSAAQQLTDSLEQQAGAARGLDTLPVLGNNISALAADADEAQQQASAYARALFGLSAASGVASASIDTQHKTLQEMNGEMLTAQAASATYLAGLDEQARTVETVTSNAQMLANTYHISVPAAMALAGAANVSLTSELKNQKGQWTALGEQVRSYVAGLGAMGPASGMVGSDMLALAIDTGLAGTKVSQVNQAFDQFMSNVTGGTSGMGEFEESLQNIGQVAATAKNNLGESAGLSLSVSQFAQALTSFTGTGAQAWQNFNQIIGSTLPQLVDWFRTAEAEDAIAGPAVSKSVLDMAASMVKFAKDSPTAQAELLAFAQNAGLNIKTFPQLEQAIKDTDASTGNLTKNVNSATVALGNMNQIAQNLGDVMDSQVTSAITNAALKTSGYYTDVQNLTNALHDNGTYGGHTAAYWAQQTALAYQRAGAMAQTATGDMAKATTQAESFLKWWNQLQSKTLDLNIVTNVSGAQAPAGVGLGHLGTGASAQAGTNYAHGGLTLVGEMGPELVRLPAGAAVTPSWQTAPLLGGGGGGGEGTLNFSHRSNISVNSRVIGNVIRTESLTFNRRNPANNLSLRHR